MFNKRLLIFLGKPSDTHHHATNNTQPKSLGTGIDHWDTDAPNGNKQPIKSPTEMEGVAVQIPAVELAKQEDEKVGFIAGNPDVQEQKV